MDGGLGTTLERNHGITFDSKLTPLWSSHLLVSDPETLQACQSSFGRVPIDIILTATYQTSVAGFGETRTDAFPAGISKGLIPQFLDRAVRIAEESLIPGRDHRVALSIGPYGACMIPSQEYTGVYDLDLSSLREWHRERLEIFAATPNIVSRVRFLAVETVPRIDEIKILRQELGSNPTLKDIPYWISCLFPGDEGRLPDGNSVEDAIQVMLDPTLGPLPYGIGINCTKVRKLGGLLRRYEDAVARRRGASGWPALVLYPDGTEGEVYDTETQTWRLPDGDRGSTVPWAEELEKVVRETRTRGRWRQVVVGGCCMAGPDRITDLRSRLGL